MICLHCKKDGADKLVKPMSYHGTVSYKTEHEMEPWYFHRDCFQIWWDDLVWHLDVIDERMNVNIHFQRTKGSKGLYNGKPVDASWTGQDARNYLGEYEFEHRRKHPATCSGCDLVSK